MNEESIGMKLWLRSNLIVVVVGIVVTLIVPELQMFFMGMFVSTFFGLPLIFTIADTQKDKDTKKNSRILNQRSKKK